MIHIQLERAVAAATGEKLRTIQRLGFSLADPLLVRFDPEPFDDVSIVDWDEVDAERLGLFPDRQRRRSRFQQFSWHRARAWMDESRVARIFKAI